MRPRRLTSEMGAELGQLLRAQRDRRGLNQRDVALAARVSPKYLGEVERGEANVTVDRLGRIAAVLGWHPRTLFATDAPPIAEPLRHMLLRYAEELESRARELKLWLLALQPTARLEAAPLAAPVVVATLAQTPYAPDAERLDASAMGQAGQRNGGAS